MKRFNLSGWAVSHPALILFLIIALGVTGFFSSNSIPIAARACVIFSISRKRTPTVGRPNSTTYPAWPRPMRFVTSLVFTSSVPRP